MSQTNAMEMTYLSVVNVAAWRPLLTTVVLKLLNKLKQIFNLANDSIKDIIFATKAKILLNK